MADNTKSTGGIFRSGAARLLLLFLLLTILGFAGNYFIGDQESERRSSYIHAANELKVLAQEMAKNAMGAASGNVALFGALSGAKESFANNLGALRAGSPLPEFLPIQNTSRQEIQRVENLWTEMSQYVDAVLANQAAMAALRDTTSDMSISISAIEAENSKVVATMLRTGAPANEVALAQRQSVLIEQMAHGLNRIATSGATQSLTDSLARNGGTFQRVLDGMINGNKDLLLRPATDEEIRSSLVRIAELYRTVSSRIGEIQTRATEVGKIRVSADQLQGKATEMQAAVNVLIQGYESDTSEGIGSPFIGMLFGSASLVILLTMILVVYREGIRSVASTSQRNEENQAAILRLLDELADLADGDLRVQATVTESFTGAIADSINFSIDQMRGLVSRINETSTRVSEVADRTQNSAVELAKASQRQANEIASVSEAVNEMAVSIDMVSYNAAESSSVAERSVEIANKGAEVVQNTIIGMDNIRGQIQETAKRIKRLGESSQEIGDIVALINDIADQTNILSLNAAIQASMAGDAGKGFAVVADEVQRLAERSGAAAKQISALVKTIQSDTNEAVSSMEQTTVEVVQGTRLAQDAGVALGEIESVSNSLAEIIENISDAARQQAASAGKISNTMKSIQEITSKTTEGTRRTATEVGNLSKMTNELRASVRSFKLPEETRS